MAEGTIGGTPISELPASSFAYCEAGSEAVSTRCHFPIRDKSGKADAAHVRNALARLSGSPFEAKARPKVEAAAKEIGIGQPGAQKAEPMTTSQLDRWLSGKVPRRILMLPFGGPLSDGKAGVDIDYEYFDETTDIYGPFPTLRASRERVVDWHHDDDDVPSQVARNGDPKLLSMKGAILGHLNFDEDPEADGYWADWWANAGEKRRRLIALLDRKGVPMYGSTQSVAKARLLWPPEADGRIPVWPVIRHTISTSPQNTYAVVPALKATLAATNLDEIPAEALKALLVGLDADTTELLLSSPEAAVRASVLAGAEAVKAGRVLSKKNIDDLQAAIGLLSDLLSRGVLLPAADTGDELTP
jgi:hypothetical protein